MFWGVLGVFFIRYIHPFVKQYIEIVPVNMLLWFVICIGIIIFIDVIFSIMAVTKFEVAIKKVNEISENIKEKVKELKEIKEKAKLKTVAIEKSSIENIEHIIRELKITQARLKLKIYRHANRLKKAFPSMKSESISAFLSQKIDIKKLKENSKKKNKE